MINKRLYFFVLSTAFFSACIFYHALAQKNSTPVRAQGKHLLGPDGKAITLKGVNLGNWLVPEGYMFKTGESSAPRQIDELLLEMIGPDSLAAFWDRYLKNYITHDDIKFLKRIGCNHIRVPFHYKLFTNDLYMGSRNAGFEYLDQLLTWCRQENLYVLLDMHCAPGGQTGYNIDDSPGYPWLFFSKSSQDLMSEIWVKIADRYKNDPIILGFDVVNEPVASFYVNDIGDYNHRLFLLYQRIVSDIRKVDKQHIIFLSGSLWAMDFGVFEKMLDDNVVYEFHKYNFVINKAAIQQYLDFRNKNKVPIYIGETGENTNLWVKQFTALLDSNQVNWAYWPYKKMDDTKGIMSFTMPGDYPLISKYAKSDRSSYEKMRVKMPDRLRVQEALDEFLEQCLYRNNFPNKAFIDGLGLMADHQ